jgi:hypothetical protein
MSDVLAGPPPVLVAGAGMLALVLSVVVWPVVTVLVTIAHEGGHAVTGSLMGGTVKSMRIDLKSSGSTSLGGLGPLGGFLATLAGYAGSSIFGLIGAMLLADGRVSVVLWLSLVLLVLAFLATSNWFGRVGIVLVGALIALVIRYATGGERMFFAYTWIWLLLLGGFADVLTMQALRKKGGKIADLGLLRDKTYMPTSLWSGFYWLLSVVVLVVGGGILLGILQPDPRTWVPHG